jgi:hypothetical protein
LLRHEAVVLNQVMCKGRHPGIVPLLRTYLTADPPCLEYQFIEGGKQARPEAQNLRPCLLSQPISPMIFRDVSRSTSAYIWVTPSSAWPRTAWLASSP